MSIGDNTKVMATLLVRAVGMLANGIEISDENKLRVVVENATGSNSVVIRTKIKGQTSWDTLATINGNGTQVISISTYDLIQIEETAFGSASDGYVRISYSSFNEAAGSTISSIGVISGTNLTDVETFDFISGDNSINVIGDNLNNTIDLRLAGSVGIGFATISTPLGTPPVAEVAADTLTLASADSNVLITGNSGADSIDLSLSSNVTTNLNKMDTIVLSGTDISNKFVILSGTPTTGSRTRVMIKNGIEQDILTDFIVSGSTINWSGLGMDGLVEIGDELIITYN